MASYSKMVFEKKIIRWPSRTKQDGLINVFTVDDVLDLNKDSEGKLKVSNVSVQAKINALIEMGAIEIVGKRKTHGRPKNLYKFVGTFQPIPPQENQS